MGRSLLFFLVVLSAAIMLPVILNKIAQGQDSDGKEGEEPAAPAGNDSNAGGQGMEPRAGSVRPAVEACTGRELELAALAGLADGNIHHISEVWDCASVALHLDSEAGNAGGSFYENAVRLARAMEGAGLVTRPGIMTMQITDRGRKALQDPRAFIPDRTGREEAGGRDGAGRQAEKAGQQAGTTARECTDRELELALLAELADGRTHHARDAWKSASSALRLGEATVAGTAFRERTERITRRMERNGLVRMPGRETCRITGRGREVLRNPPAGMPVRAALDEDPGLGETGISSPGRQGHPASAGAGTAPSPGGAGPAAAPAGKPPAPGSSGAAMKGGGFPPFIPLETVENRYWAGTLDFRGDSVTSQDMLPEPLFGALHMPDSFRAGKCSFLDALAGRDVSGWAAGYFGSDTGSTDGVFLAWRAGVGWSFRVMWHGEEASAETSQPSATFREAVQMLGGQMVVAAQRGLARLPVHVIPAPERLPKITNPPEGSLFDLGIPLKLSSCPRAADIYRSLGRERLRGGVRGGLFLCRLHTKDGSAPGETAYVLRLTAAYHLIPALLERFEPVVSPGEAMKPFTCCLEARARTRMDITAAGVYWEFGEEWARDETTAPKVTDLLAGQRWKALEQLALEQLAREEAAAGGAPAAGENPPGQEPAHEENGPGSPGPQAVRRQAGGEGGPGGCRPDPPGLSREGIGEGTGEPAPMPEGLPPFIHVGEIDCVAVNAGGSGTVSPDTLRGGAVTSPGVLPARLLGSKLDPSSFMTGAGGRWSATWPGASGGAETTVSWSPSSGWRLDVRWLGKAVLFATAGPSATLEELFTAQVPAMASGIEKAMASLPLVMTMSPPQFLPSWHLSDGFTYELVIPLEAGRLRPAVDLFRCIPGEFRPECIIDGNIFLGRCRHEMSCGKQEEGRLRQAAEEAREQSGLPFALEPGLSGGTFSFERSVYVLRVSAPFHMMPGLLEHFRPIVQESMAMKPLACSVMVRGFFRRFEIGEGNRMSWEFGKEWFSWHGDWNDFDGQFGKVNAFLDAVDREVAKQAGGAPGESPKGTGPAVITITAAGSARESMDGSLVRQFSRYEGFRVFFANAILNPMGPTYEFLCARKDDMGPGRSADLYWLSLHPRYPSWKQAGTIGFPALWDGGWEGLDVRGLAAVMDADSSVGVVTPGLWLPAGMRRELLEIIYGEKGERIPQKLAQLELYPRDIFSRFDADMAEIAHGGEDGGMPAAKLRSEDEAVRELVRLSLDPGFQKQEFANFSRNWKTCVEYFMHGAAEVTLQDFMAYCTSFLNREVYQFRD